MLGKTPFGVLYGQTPRHLGISDISACTAPNLEGWLKERALLSTLIQQLLLRAQQRMKQQADKNRLEQEFAVGEEFAVGDSIPETPTIHSVVSGSSQ